MTFRAKFAGAFVVVLAAAILAASVVDISWALDEIADEVIDSGNAVASETFEQVRTVLAHTHEDPTAALRTDPNLMAGIESVQAFAKGIVFIDIEAAKGEAILGEQSAAAAFLSIDTLRGATQSHLPFQLLHALWHEHNYVVVRPVLINNQPFAVIRVGVSTALINDEVHQLIWATLGAGLLIVLFAAGAGSAIGGLLSRSVVAAASGEPVPRGADGANLTVGRGDELGNLTEKFNRLSRQVLSERKRWESEQGGLFKALRTMTDAIILVDADGSILFANAEAQARLPLGTPSGDGKLLRGTLGRTHPLIRMVEASLATGTEAHDVAIELKDKTQRPFRCLVSIFPLSRGREAVGLLVTLRDLKPVAELETVIEYSSRLARLGGLISGVAHQIRKPLNVLTIRLEWLRQDAEQGGPLDPHIDSIRYEIDRLDRVVDGLLRFLRPEHLELAKVPVADLLTEAGGQVTSLTIRVKYLIDGSLPELSADRSLLAEAFRNIFQNAAESMPDGGQITVTASLRSDGFIEVSVADQGRGIEAAQLERIFDLYFTTKPGGTGLGLTLALRAVDLHHGTIEIDSGSESGTTVRICLPAGQFPGNLGPTNPLVERSL